MTIAAVVSRRDRRFFHASLRCINPEVSYVTTVQKASRSRKTCPVCWLPGLGYVVGVED